MPPRKPFRPDKNRDRGRSQHGSRDAESGRAESRPSKPWDNRSQEKKKSWGRARPRSDERAAPGGYSSESEDSKPRREPDRNRDEAQAGYKASGGSYWITAIMPFSPRSTTRS